MAELGEYHKRRILAAFQHMNKLLSQSLHVLAQSHSDARPRHVQDISPSKRLRIEKHVQLIREQLNKFLERFQIILPEPSTPLSWLLRTNLTSLDITLEDLYPQKMKGYGEMDPAAANELTQIVQEVREEVNQLLQLLDQD